MEIDLSNDQEKILLFILEKLSLSMGMSLRTIQESNFDIPPSVIKETLELFVRHDLILNQQGDYRFPPESYYKLNLKYQCALKKKKKSKDRRALIAKSKEVIVLSFAKKTPAIVSAILGFILGLIVDSPLSLLP